ncbi:MAG TPA: hypothetical protein VL084_06675 [Thermoanaerobaculia bacterium]|nr:hypothetical protein [Thermoanaerobaculia bacterium]
MNRREFAKMALGAATMGVLAGKTLLADDKPKAEGTDKHACKGMNSCKGKGGCKSGDNGCAGKNSCKGKGGCAVPVKKAA